MIDFWPKAIFSQRFPPKISSLQATSKNTVSQNCYLLSVICNAKNSFLETVNCQTVTLAIDIGFALMMSEMYVFYPYTMLGK